MRGRSEETAALVWKLYQPEGFRERLIGKASDRKVELLQEIGASGDLLAVTDIIHLACDRDSGVARAAASAVHELLLTATLDDLVWLDGQARFTTPVDYHNSWLHLRVSDVENFTAFPEPYVSLLGVASMHPSGHVRQKAVTKLASIRDGLELPFLLLRVNDWVAQVSGIAKDAVNARFQPEYAGYFVANLALVIRLLRVRRADHSELIRQMMDVIKGPEAHVALRLNFLSPDKIVRRMSYELALASPREDRRDALESAMKQQDPVVRVNAAKLVGDILGGDDLKEALITMVRDPFPQVRRTALQNAYTKLGEDARDMLKGALLDRSASVRETARYYLRRMGEKDFAPFYRRALAERKADQLLGAIGGIAETGTADDAELLLPFVSQGTVRVRKTALRAVAKLGGDAYISVYVQGLMDERPGVWKTGRDVLAGRAQKVGTAQLMDLFATDKPLHVRQTALHLLASLGKWSSLPYLIRAKCDPDEQISNLAYDLLKNWLITSNRSFISPSESQLAEIELAMKECGYCLDEKLREAIVFALK